MAYINGDYSATVRIRFCIDEAEEGCAGYGEIKRRMQSYTSALGELIKAKADYGRCGTIEVIEKRANVWRSEKR